MKVRIDKAGAKKYLHNLQHEVKSTASFGFCEPILCREMIAQDSINLRIGQSCFLSTMPKPTFGSLDVKTYVGFVPVVELFHPFESMLSGQGYHGSEGYYVPAQTPDVAISCYTQILNFCSNFDIYRSDGTTITATGFVTGDITAVTNVDERLAVIDELYTQLSVGSYNFTQEVNRLKFSQAQGVVNFPATVPDSLPECDHVHVLVIGSAKYIACGWYTYYGRNIRKVFIGCGYQFNDSSDTLSLLPLFAYYKFWFDNMMPSRSKTWKETHAFSFLERIEQRNQAAYAVWFADSQTETRFADFIMDIGLCYYTQNPDYVSAHITGAALPIASQGSNSTSVLNAGGNGQTAITSGSSAQPYIASSASLTQNALDTLRKLYQYVNAKTAIGGRVKEFIRSMYDASSLNEEDSTRIGTQFFELTLTHEYSTAQTDKGDLAELAGKGLGSSPGKKFKYICKQQGFLIAFYSFVPRAKYAQAIDPLLRHKTKFDYFIDRFDSITLLPTPKYCVYGNKEVFVPSSYATTEDYAQGFGNIPNYMEYKIAYNKLNGDMSRAGSRSTFLAYSLDKLLPYRTESRRADGHWTYNNVPVNVLVAADYWRWIGRNEYLGWFNRIFVNSGVVGTSPVGEHRGSTYVVPPVDDNFVIYNNIDLSVRSMALPTADSWQTGVSGDSMEIEKA